MDTIARLRVLTFEETLDATLTAEPCLGTMTCGCAVCEIERAQLLARGVRSVRQPWEIAA